MAHRVRPRRDIDLPSWLAYLYAPILPSLRRVRVRRAGPRGFNPQDILLPAGYTAELVASGFNAPVHCCFDDQGSCYVVEAGHKVDGTPRILKVLLATGAYEPFFTWPAERWVKTGAVTGACWHDGFLYVYNKLYFGVGSATNAGVVGADNFAYEWLPAFPTFHDVPAHEVTLTGRNYAYRNVLGSVAETVHSGAYVPFGSETSPGQVVPGDTRCTGSILRCDPDGSNLEVVALGLRNPYGIAFHPDGRLFATEHGIDERGGRYIVGDYDDFYEIETGEWYGWPDFASGFPLDHPRWGSGGQGREPALARHPNPSPPRPVVSFEPHAGANGVAFSRNPSFGFEGDAFVALFGDLAPITTARLAAPAGFKVVRVETATRRVVDFAVSKIAGPASKLPHDGFERPSHCAFGPDGHLYVVDWGEIEIAPERGGVRMRAGTGALWRIRRTAGPAGDRPPEPLVLPTYRLTALAAVAGAAGLVGLIAWWLRSRRAS